MGQLQTAALSDVLKIIEHSIQDKPVLFQIPAFWERSSELLELLRRVLPHFF